MKHTFEMRMKDLIKERSLQLFTLKPEFFSGFSLQLPKLCKFFEPQFK